MPFFISLIILFALTLGGSLLFFLIRQPLKQFINFFLTFSGAFLLGITFLKLFPHLFEKTDQPGLYIVIGFLLQILLESLSKGVEHGHLHIGNPGKLFPWSISIGLAVHAFMEGMPLSSAFTMDQGMNFALYMGVLLHKIPAAFVLFTVVMNHGINRTQALLILTGFALMTPLGAMISEWLLVGEGLHNAKWIEVILGIVVGAFLHIGTTIIQEAQDKHQFAFYQALALVLGFLISSLTL